VKDSAKRRLPSAAERALWREATRDAVPLAGRPAVTPDSAPLPVPCPEKPVSEGRKPVPRPVKIAARPIDLPHLGLTKAPGLDSRSAERLKRGQLPIRGILDLHGMTQAAARSALDHFIADAHAQGRRAVLIITGQGLRGQGFNGSGDQAGVLKTMTPRWLNEAPNRARVLAFTQAQPRHGGAGAIYVLIRRQRGTE
jgi:DNA-nicking Smr family endonuclease